LTADGSGRTCGECEGGKQSAETREHGGGSL
jgi:hypothetical protein